MIASDFSGAGDPIRILEFEFLLSEDGLFGVPADLAWLITPFARVFRVRKSFSNLLTNRFLRGLSIDSGCIPGGVDSIVTALLVIPGTRLCFRHAL